MMIATTAEKISIALPQEMLTALRQAVAAGEYASSSEAVCDALRDWSDKRLLRPQGPTGLRQLWQQALDDPRPPVDALAVLDRLERKYQALARPQVTAA